ncbi:MAG: hypothetical protein HYU68_06670 [Bacteroidetes bacterium]|nr:hypothetical protein [Bacteroidota bacterium]
MDIGITITGAILIAICILPFVLMGRNSRKHEKLLFQSLSNIAAKQNCKITQHECCEEYIIGIDETSNFLFFFKRIKDKEISKQINLADIQSCKIVKTSRSSDNEKIDKLELSLLPSLKNKANIILELYNSDERMHLGDDFLLIERWAKKINELLKLNNQHVNQPV